MNFSELIYNERVKRRLSQQYIADCMKVSRTTIMDWEREKYDIPLKQAQKLVELFNISYTLGTKKHYDDIRVGTAIAYKSITKEI